MEELRYPEIQVKKVCRSCERWLYIVCMKHLLGPFTGSGSGARAEKRQGYHLNYNDDDRDDQDEDGDGDDEREEDERTRKNIIWV